MYARLARNELLGEVLVQEREGSLGTYIWVPGISRSPGLSWTEVPFNNGFSVLSYAQSTKVEHLIEALRALGEKITVFPENAPWWAKKTLEEFSEKNKFSMPSSPNDPLARPYTVVAVSEQGAKLAICTATEVGATYIRFYPGTSNVISLFLVGSTWLSNFWQSAGRYLFNSANNPLRVRDFLRQAAEAMGEEIEINPLAPEWAKEAIRSTIQTLHGPAQVVITSSRVVVAISLEGTSRFVAVKISPLCQQNHSGNSCILTDALQKAGFHSCQFAGSNLWVKVIFNGHIGTLKEVIEIVQNKCLSIVTSSLKAEPTAPRFMRDMVKRLI